MFPFQISELSNTDNWFWCPGVLNPADLLTRSGSTENIKSRFWLQGSFLSTPTSSWPAKPFASLILYQTPAANINKISCISINQLTATITESLERTGSYTTLLNAMCLLCKRTRSYKHHSAPIFAILLWNNV